MSDIDLARELHGTTDAEVWAVEFMKLARTRSPVVVDTPLMVTWFANAIETGRTAGQAGQRELETQIKADNAELRTLVHDLRALVAQHEETIGKLADVAKAARDTAEWMRAGILTLADDPRYATPSGPAPAALRRIAAGPPADAVAVGRRLPACVEAWPECHSGGYDPRCCRFPKSCSCLSFAAGPTAEEAT